MGQILSNEVKKSSLSCTSMEELHELAKESGYELSDEELEGISGGIFPPIGCLSVYRSVDEG